MSLATIVYEHGVRYIPCSQGEVHLCNILDGMKLHNGWDLLSCTLMMHQPQDGGEQELAWMCVMRRVRTIDTEEKRILRQ